MITAGVDAGNKYTRVVILKDGQVLAKGEVVSGFNQQKAADDSFNLALQEAGLSKENVNYVIATGAGKTEVAFSNSNITDLTAATKGAKFICPTARFVVDVGAEESRVAKIDKDGRVVDFAVNEKCAAGAGSFVEAMSRALEIPIEQMGELSLQSTKTVQINAQCAVFAESEVVSLIHANTAKKDIANAVNDAMASRIMSMVRRVGVEKDLVIIGGMANNRGFVKSMEDGLEMKVVLPAEPNFVGALGAAVVAAEKALNV